MWCRFCLCIAVYTQQLRAWTAIVSNMIWQYRTQVQILCDGFDSRLESIAFDIYIRWLLIRTTQARLAVSLQHRWTFNSIVIPVSARLPCFSSLQNALLLLPVSAEQSFRKLKFIKTFITSNMANSRLSFFFPFVGIFIHLSQKAMGRYTSSLRSCRPSVYLPHLDGESR